MRVRLLVLLVASSGWGLWCWLLATEYVVDYRGEEWSVGLFSVLAALGVWAVLILAAVATWRALTLGGSRGGLARPTEGKPVPPDR